MRTVRWLVAALLISGCRPYGSIASLATPDVRTSAVEFAGRWRAPDPMRFRATGAGGGSRWSTTAVFEVRGDSLGWLQVQSTPDAACPVEGNDFNDTLRYRGSLVRLGAMRLLELSLSDDALEESLLPLKQWHRITHVGDTLFREAWALLDKVEWQGSQVRLVGVTATRLRSATEPPAGQLPLFPGGPDPRRNLARTVDKIRERFGGEAITRASLLVGNGEPTRKSREPRTESREPRRKS